MKQNSPTRSHRRPSLVRSVAAALALPILVAGILAMAATASASPTTGSLTSYLGTKPDGTGTPAGPWTGVNYGSLSGGNFGVTMPADAPLDWSQQATLTIPADLSHQQSSVDRVFDAPVSWAVYQPRIITTWETRGMVPGYGYVGDSGSGTVQVSGARSSLSMRVFCEYFYGSDAAPRCTGGGYWYVRRMELVLGDQFAPTATLTDDGGGLLADGWITSATSNLTVTASDRGSGAYRAFFRTSGTTHHALLAPASPTCKDIRPEIGDDYEFAASTSSLVPCLTAQRDYTPEFDLAAIGDGTHTGTLGIEDASGREAIIGTGYTIRINAPDGTLADPGTPCENGTHDASGTCITRPPVNTSIPALTGTARQEQQLVTDTGAWNDIENVTWSYAWEACEPDGSDCQQITARTEPGFTSTGLASSTITLGSDAIGKRIRSVVTATTNGGTDTVRSTLSSVVTAKLAANTIAPALSGVVQAGEELTSTVGTWTNTSAPHSTTVRWERCNTAGGACTTIPGATGTAHTLTSEDAGATVRSAVTWTNWGGGQATAYSPASPIVYPASGSGSGTGGSGSVRGVKPIVLSPAGGGGGGGGGDGTRDESSNPMLPVPPAPDGYDGVSFNGANASADAVLAAQIRGQNSRARYGQRRLIEGQLVTKDGTPIADAQIDIVSHLVMAGARATIDGAVKTDEKGHFSYRLAASPSRIVTFGYRLRLSDRYYSTHRSLTVKVTPKVSLTAGAKRVVNGATVRLTGKVTGAPSAARKLVEIQVRKGKRWRTFATTRLRDGAYSYRYRFSRTNRTTTYRLRALVRADATWPLQTGRSSTRKVKVIG